MAEPLPTGLQTTFEYDDLAGFPSDGNRYEILEGELYTTPAPSPLHQRVSKRLQRMLEAYFEDRGIGEVFNAPVDVILTRRDVVEPDLVVVDTPAQVTPRAIEGPPLLVVEVLSPSTARTDRGVKSRRYAELGVRHYWIVDIDAQAIECYRLDDGRYELVHRAGSGDEFRHPDWVEMEVFMATLWSRLSVS
jgi:Uma2 family endonuclease